MIRVIVRTSDCGAAANVGGPVDLYFKTFDVPSAELEHYLTEDKGKYSTREVVGVEVLAGKPEVAG